MASRRRALAVPADLEGVPLTVRPIVEAARAVIRAVAPDAEEIACMGPRPRSPSMMWKLVRYAAGGHVVVTVGAFTRHVSMFFARGRELDDGGCALEGLEGGGARLRYFSLRAPEDARRPAVARVIGRAFALERDDPGGHAPARAKSAKRSTAIRKPRRARAGS